MQRDELSDSFGKEVSDGREKVRVLETTFKKMKMYLRGLDNFEDFLVYLNNHKEIYEENQLAKIQTLMLEELESQKLLLNKFFSNKPAVFTHLMNGNVEIPKIQLVRLPMSGENKKSAEILENLKTSWVGRTYITHLKKFSLFRSLAFWLWKSCYPIYANNNPTLFFGRKKSWRPLVKLADYVDSLELTIIRVFDGVHSTVSAPNVFPMECTIYIGDSSQSIYTFPPIYVTTINKTQVYGGSNLVFLSDIVICHDLYNFESDFTSEELHGRHKINVNQKRIFLSEHDQNPVKVQVAATFLDACAPNYAHWMTEVLPRIAVFCSIERFNSVPIIVNADLHSNIIQSLSLVAGGNRKIIMVPIGRAIEVDTLYVTSVAGYVPFEPRKGGTLSHQHGIFSHQAFDLIRKQVSFYTEKIQTKEFPKKIYLKRTSHARVITNEEEIEAVLRDLGYTVVIPEKLNFLQQAVLFECAESIVAPSGAALANAIFCRPGTQIHILIGQHENMLYWYWVNVLSSVAISPNLVLGRITNPQNEVHSDFYVDIKDLLNSMNIN